MNKRQAITILEEYNEWRKGAETPMLKPQLITKALDYSIRFMKGETK
jgi:hypothetical protein